MAHPQDAFESSPVNLSERLLGDEPVTTRPSLGSIAFTALNLGSRVVNAILPHGPIVTSTYSSNHQWKIIRTHVLQIQTHTYTNLYYMHTCTVHTYTVALKRKLPL